MTSIHDEAGDVAPLPEHVVRRLREIVEERAGLVVDARRAEALAGAVAEIERDHGLDGPDAVVRAVEQDASGGAAFADLVAHLRVGETHFFRNRPHFRGLRQFVLPELLDAARAERRALVLWSAGCSTGEEAWSLAMALAEVAEARGVGLASLDAVIVATDFDASQLEVARVGEYGSYSFRGVTDEERERHFERVDGGSDGPARWRVKDRYRPFVRFDALNLVTDPFPDPTGPLHDVDLIVCRNVTIYFGPATTRRLAERFRETLREGGYLLVGHSEHSLETYRSFETRALPDLVIYQRGGDRPHEDVAPGAAWLPPKAAVRMPPPRSRRLAAADVPLSSDSESSSRAEGEGRLEAALAALAAGDRNAAVAETIAALESEPENAAACRLLGRVAADRGHAREAEIWLQRAVDLEPLDPEGHYLLAILAAERDEVREALRRLERATYLEPELIVAHHLRARLQLASGQRERAAHSAALARRFLASLPPDAEVPLSQGLTARQLASVLERLP